ncbi:MAG: hypothetical protein M3410_14145 [Acidobacteriota bacterium]|nr:hypothetical protein [Acidobacteriota bacterium]
MTLCFFISLILLQSALACVGQTQGAQSVNHSRRDVKRHADRSSPGGEIHFSSFAFLRSYLGREGPNFLGLEGEPSAGFDYLAKAELFGLESAATVKFEMVDARGRVIQPLGFSKSNNAVDDGEFVGLVKVPAQPFRIKVTGTHLRGGIYEQVYRKLFQPTNRPLQEPLLPPGFPREQAQRIRDALKEQERQMKAEYEKKIGTHNNGVIVLPRIQVSNVTYEPYLSDTGNLLGIRLRYNIEYSADGDYAHSLQVIPDYRDANMRGLVEMQVVNERVNPIPSPPSYATPNIHVDLKTLVKYGSAAWFGSGVVYQFTIDLVPDFVGQNATKTKFCVDEVHYQQKVKSRQAWEHMKASGAHVSYKISMNQVHYGGDTGPWLPPKTFYEGFLKEGAVRCKPYKNIHF